MDVRLRNKVLGVKLLILDVDGVLTDGRIVFDDAGLQSKFFDVKDGHGLKMLMRCGIDVVLLTGRLSRVVEHRAADLGITEVHQRILDKAEALDKILTRRNLTPEQTAYVGDDVVDIPVFNRVGLAVAVADAVAEARAAADYVTRHRGGRGAVREVCELILKGQERWADVAAKYGFPWPEAKGQG
ncbi:MAG: HAD-IIIA family hydrolase [Deltaproteobacteria bacterium]|nr:HAD-IIIA family hydrolase [Deltaproteobacteria bacterium]